MTLDAPGTQLQKPEGVPDATPAPKPGGSPGAAPAPSKAGAGATGWSPNQIGVANIRERRLPHVLLIGIALFIIMALAWAAYFQIEELVRADGRVITKSQIQVVTNLEGGIIAEVMVREGDLVKKDQPLMRIDPTRFIAAFREGEQGSLALKARIARLRAETGLSSFAMPLDVQKGSPTVAQQESALYHTRQAEQDTNKQTLSQQLLQRESELKETQSRSERLAEQLALVEREYKITAPLVKRGIVSEVELLRLEREQTRTRTDLEQARLSIPRVQAAIAEARSKLADVENAFRSRAGMELAQAQAEFSKTSQQMPALEDRATRTLVLAPMDGIVKTIPNKTVGGVVQPGSPMVEMVPVEDMLLVEAHLRPSDIAFVHLGQRAQVKITAYDYSIFGGLEGKIEYVAADSVVPPPQQGEPYYVAHIRTVSNSIDYFGKRLSISPGMLASVDIITGSRSILYYVTKPLNRARERAMTER